jgi:carotenoid cleavage dioxygenase-like enzyme
MRFGASIQVATRVAQVEAELAMLHDFAVTDSYYVLVTGSTRMNVGRFLTSYVFGRSAIAECIEFAPGVPAKVGGLQWFR